MAGYENTISGANPPLQDAELALAIVSPIGTNLDRFQNQLRRSIRRFGYTLNPIRMSELMPRFDAGPAPEVREGSSQEFKRLSESMYYGSTLRLRSKRGEFLALVVAKAVNDARKDGAFRPRVVHLFRSLKHPDEVRALRRIYGPGFFLIGVTTDEVRRRSYLVNDKGCSESEADELISRDEHEEDEKHIDEKGFNYGQRTRDTFQLADVFLRLDDEGELDRFLDLVFGYPHATPSRDEHAMFLSFAAALRSADLSRQVGAVVLSREGDVIALGANDVPRAGGGLYWPGPDDVRDHIKGYDSNERRKSEIMAGILQAVRPESDPSGSWSEKASKALKTTEVNDITEYGRAVHAEMEALIACARTGTSPRRGTLYSTTFPCHNCAKHIIAAGLSRVVYVEPYPKSQAAALFSDSIVLGQRREGNKVRFEPFVGVGARRFFDLFSLALSSGTSIRRKQGGAKAEWEPKTAVVRVPMMPNSYLERERIAAAELVALTQQNAEGTTTNE